MVEPTVRYKCALCGEEFKSTLPGPAAFDQAQTYGWRFDGDLVRKQAAAGEEIDGLVCWRHDPIYGGQFDRPK